jgi:sugar/nucleoside kinase (ribokinase family)
MTKKIEISGTGCCLVDYLFNPISFTSETFSKYLSKRSGDGGLTPGQLVFVEEFEKFCGQDFQSILQEITKGKSPDKINVGGPSIVSLIHAAQMLENDTYTVRFYGGRGKDEAGNYLQDVLEKAPVNIDNYRIVEGTTPFTIVLSDPDYHEGAGERIFINSLGAAKNYGPEYLDTQFFSSAIVAFGGTALVPPLHDNLTKLLTEAKKEGCMTVVNTVYDFRNQKANPDQKWPLGKSDESYRKIDLLIADYEEALRLSGKKSLKGAMEFFRTAGTGAVIVTNGAKDVMLYAGKDSIFDETELMGMPVSAAVTEELKKGSSGDTTGCGDNFAGGIIASMAMQLQQNRKKIDLKEACSWGIVSGGFSCFYMGGTYHEKETGEKLQRLFPYYQAYLKQIHYE